MGLSLIIKETKLMTTNRTCNLRIDNEGIEEVDRFLQILEPCKELFSL